MSDDPYVDPIGLGECDCQEKDCAELEDLKDYINEQVNGQLKRDGNPERNVSKLGENNFGNHNGWSANIETAINSLPKNPKTGKARQLKKDVKDTKYKDATGKDAPAWVKPKEVLSPCILVCGVCMGSDKIGHFIQQGYEYYKVEKMKGVGAAEVWSQGTEKGMMGLGFTGVYSEGDLEAIRKGGKAYKDFAGGANNFNICDYVTANFNEEKNPGKCCESLQKKIGK